MSFNLTKSKFKLALECPTKLYYVDKREYANQQTEDAFLKALAEGGYQVEALARCYYPQGILIKEDDNKSSITTTQKLLLDESIILFEAAIQYKRYFVRADILIKDKNHLKLIEVKAKSIDKNTSTKIEKRDGTINADWKSYIADIAFQKWVLQNAYPNYRISSYLMLIDKDSLCPTDGLNQKFILEKDQSGKPRVKIADILSAEDLSVPLLKEMNVDDLIEKIWTERDEKGIDFKNQFQEFSDYYFRDKKSPPIPKKECAKCQFRTLQDEAGGFKSGFKECWTGKLLPQDSNDTPTSDVAKKIGIKKKKLNEVLLKEFFIPKSWEWYYISDLCDLKTGATPRTARSDYYGGSIRWLVSGDINKNEIYDCEGRITEAGLNNSNCKLLPKNSVLIALNGQGKTRATVAILRVEAACNQSLVAMISKYQDLILPEFIMLNLRYRYFEIRDITGQNQRRGLNMGLISKLSISVPPLAEQSRILAKVDELMTLCDQLETKHNNSVEAQEKLVSHLLSTLTQSQSVEDFNENWQRIAEHFDILFTTEFSIDALKQTLLQLAVMGKLVPQDPSDEPASELLKKISADKEHLIHTGKIKKHSPVKHIGGSALLPPMWKDISVQDFADVRLGSTPSRAQPAFWGGDIPWVSSGEVAHKIIVDTAEKITSEGFKGSSVSIIPNRSVLIAIIGQGKTRGQSALLGIDACINQNIAALIFNEKYVVSEFVWIWAQSKYEAPRGDGRGGAQPALNGNIVKGFRFYLPPLAEQKRIVAKVDELVAVCSRLKAKLIELRELQQKIADIVIEKAIAH